jgi:hypothetical protein
MFITILSPCQLAPGYNILLPGVVVDVPYMVAQCWIAAGRAEQWDKPIHTKLKTKKKRND